MKAKSVFLLRHAFSFFYEFILLLLRRNRKVLAFELASIGELQFFQNILLAYVERFPKHLVYIAHNGDTVAEFKKRLPLLNGRVRHIHRFFLYFGLFSKIDLFFTTEQYHLGIDGIYSICLFHGQPSKGLTFSKQIIFSFDAFFLYGPLQRQTYEEFLIQNKMVHPAHLELFEIGYAKSDDLISAKFDSKSVLDKLGLPHQKKTILYAPAFNIGASLHTKGMEIINVLTNMKDFNIIVKLPVDCYDSSHNYFKTAGINWPQKLNELANEKGNFKLYEDYFIDPLLACADVLVTCVSSISFEFFAIHKPVVFIHTPLFFNSYLQQLFPHDDTQKWVNNITVNAGRKYGVVIDHTEELPSAIERALKMTLDSSITHALLFNPGKATHAAIDKISDLINSHVRSRRPHLHRMLFIRFMRRVSGIFSNFFLRLIKKWLHYKGFKIEKLGTGYLDVHRLAQRAKCEDLSLCDYLEFHDDHYKKIGRRDRIIQKMYATGIFQNCKNICEIGPGTGRYLEKALEYARPEVYDIYETEISIKAYLIKMYSAACLKFHESDGQTLRQTRTNSCDLVHAHAVFVCIPMLLTISYLLECVRVCKPGGYIVFDCFVAEEFTLQTIKNWLYSAQFYPVLIPQKFISEFAKENSLKLVLAFKEIYGSSNSNYFIYQKI